MLLSARSSWPLRDLSFEVSKVAKVISEALDHHLSAYGVEKLSYYSQGLAIINEIGINQYRMTNAMG